MMKLFLCTLTAGILFINANCDRDIVDPPSVLTDTIITVEKELADGEQPAVSPDGSKIAFVRKGDIWVMDTSGVNQKQLTNSADIDIIPRWKPDGQSIGFIRTTTGEYNKGKIFAVLPAGGGESQIVQNYFAADSFVTASSGISYPIWDWSSDGEYIALLEQQGYKTYLKVINISNSELLFTQMLYDYLTAKASNESCFTWSHNKNEIAFIAQGISGWRDIILKDFINFQTNIDSTYQTPYSLCRQPITGNYTFIKNFGTVILKNFKNNNEIPYIVYAGGGLKWAQDEKNIVFELQGIVSGPFGYRYSSLSVFNFERNKQYTLTHQGDINITNYFFEWSQKNNEIFFERFKKINKVTFQFSN